MLLLLSSVYLMALLSFGLLISSRAQLQMEAMQMAMGIMLPSILLSGYIFPLASRKLMMRASAPPPRQDRAGGQGEVTGDVHGGDAPRHRALEQRRRGSARPGSGNRDRCWRRVRRGRRRR